MGNDPAPLCIGIITTNHTTITTNKVLCHIRKHGLSHFTKLKSSIVKCSTVLLYAPGHTHACFVVVMYCDCTVTVHISAGTHNERRVREVA